MNQMMTVFGHSKAQNCGVIDHMYRPVVETHGCEESVLDVARRVAFEVAERDRGIRVQVQDQAVQAALNKKLRLPWATARNARF